MNTTKPMVNERRRHLGPLAIRAAFGGALMGLANLVPGISGGTMLLASGVYPRFIAAIAEITTFKFRRESTLVLGVVTLAAAIAILLLAGTVKDLVVHHRWVMYSLFIGLTLGGVPVIWRMIDRATPTLWAGAAAGFAAMAVLATAQAGNPETAGTLHGPLMMMVAGIAGASAMILPGVSGGYLLLVLGVYLPILAGIEALKLGLAARDVSVLLTPLLEVVVPVGIGVVIGVVVVSHALRWVMERFRSQTLGVLLGLLLGAVMGLWPFQEGIPPDAGYSLKGQTVEVLPNGRRVLQPSGRPVKPQDYPTASYTPDAVTAATALGLVLGGFAATWLVARFAREDG